MELPANLIESSITRGTILHSTIFEEIDHGKYFVIIGVSEEQIAGFFFINSNIHPSLESKPEQFSMQYPMKKADYPFLRYDSFFMRNQYNNKETFRFGQEHTKQYYHYNWVNEKRTCIGCTGNG